MSRKRKRQGPEVDTELAELYDKLAHDDESIRLKAASALLSKISPENRADQTAQQKALKRLVRGLSSGRKSARIGFSVAFTEFLRQYGEPSSAQTQSLVFPAAIDELENTTNTSADTSGPEARDQFLGRLFGAATFIQSGVLFAGSNNQGSWERVLDLIVGIAIKKPWLREECGWILYSAVNSLSAVPDGQAYATTLISRLGNGLLKSPEGIAIWIATRRNFPKLKLPPSVYHDDDPLHKKEKSTVARILKEGSSISVSEQDDEQTQQSYAGVWNARLNFAWQVVFDELAQRSEKGSFRFADLWKEAVEESLFAMKSSHERRYWGLQLFQQYIAHGNVEFLPAIFGPNLMRCLMNQMALGDRLLNTAATQCLQAIVSRATDDKASIQPMVSAILEYSVNFDRAARSKVVEKLLAEADLDGVESLIGVIRGQMELKKTSPQDVLSLADYLVSIVRTHDLPQHGPEQKRFRAAINSALDALVDLSFKGANEDTNAAAMRARVTSCLNHVITKDTVDPAYHPYHTLQSIKSRGIRLDADDAVAAIIAKGHETLDKIVRKSEKADEKDVLHAFKLLFTFALLQAYYGEADAVNVVDELQDCFRSLDKKSHVANYDENVVALVEVIIDFVSKQSALYRRLAPKILASITDRIPVEGLDALLGVLETKEDMQGQDELFSTAAEDELDVEMADGPHEDSDIEEGSADDGSTASDSETSGEDKADSSSEEADAAEAAELAEFDAKLANALGTRRADDDVAVNASESEDSDMDDAQMEGLDEQLGNMFKHRMGGGGKGSTARKDRKRARDTIVNFKTKVLELLEVYVKQEHRNPRALHIVAPLLRAMQATSSSQISQKIGDLVRHFSKLYKAKRSVADMGDARQHASAATQLLQEVHTIVGNTTSQLQAKACSSASLLAVKAMLSYEAPVDDAAKAYERTLGSLKTDGAFKFRQCFAEDWRNWLAQAAKTNILQA